MIVYNRAREETQIATAIDIPGAPPAFSVMLMRGAADQFLQDGPVQAFVTSLAKMSNQERNLMKAHVRGRIHPAANLYLVPGTHFRGTRTVKPDGTLQLSRDFVLTRLGKIQILARSEGLFARDFVDWLSQPEAVDHAVTQATNLRNAMNTRNANRTIHNTTYRRVVDVATHAVSPAQAAMRASQDFQAALRHPEDKVTFGRNTKKEIVAANNGNPNLQSDLDYYKKSTCNSLATPECLAKMAVFEAEAAAMAVAERVPFNVAKMAVIRNKGNSMLPKGMDGNILPAEETRKRHWNHTFAAAGTDSMMEPARRRLAIGNGPAPLDVN